MIWARYEWNLDVVLPLTILEYLESDDDQRQPREQPSNNNEDDERQPREQLNIHNAYIILVAQTTPCGVQ